MFSGYQLKITDLYNVPVGNIKKLEPNISDKEKFVLHSKNLHLRLGLKQQKYITY